MRWQRTRRSSNVEDRRRGGGKVGGKGLLGGGIGTIVIALVAMYFGVDPQLINSLVGGLEGGTASQSTASEPIPTNDPQAQFVAAVLGDTETTWHEIFAANNARYQEPKLVLFSGAVRSACGHAQAAMGPFYCPGDKKVYIDLSFFRDLANKYQAPGDFAQAYVIAHEVGHHIQTLLGISSRVHMQKQQVSKTQANALSVKQELQADCFAGVWAHYAKNKRDLLEPGDLEEGLKAASAVGDDRLQKQAQGYVVPESFTHGSSEQRMQWFQVGFKAGDLNRCDTFTKM
ncbi:KPN_02809 family neutral zinc metallopeptidase [Halioxenophilus aromaticivorans]|uniref:Neutral zinc metallopeptidase n=1 Tax=Halioxenophilus aromaticivorans TaxID=1306992 RepID=A0AAV3U3G3_9ALTE